MRLFGNVKMRSMMIYQQLIVNRKQKIVSKIVNNELSKTLRKKW